MGAGSAARRRSNAYVDPRDIEGCEALLESHFTQVGATAFCNHDQAPTPLQE